MTRRRGAKAYYCRQGRGLVYRARTEGLNAPSEAPFRLRVDSPAPVTPLDELFAEMFANDPEAIEWRRAEERAEWAVRR